MDMSVDINENSSGSKEEMRKNASDESKMRKIEKCANPVEITFFCELEGYDIKTLNMATGKGSYMLKVGERIVPVTYTSKRKEVTKNVILSVYKFKSFRGFLRRAAEVRLLKLKAAGNVIRGPCTPNTNYPHQEILDAHIEMGYHLQGSCTPKCLVRRIYGSMDFPASVKVIPPYIAKPSGENIPTPVNEYLEKEIGNIFGLNCVTYHNGKSTLKVEIFNIINRKTGTAVNNFMKHTASGVFPFKVVFTLNSGNVQESLENVGFFIDTLFEVNGGCVQLGADKNNGSGQVKIAVTAARINQKIPEVEKFIKTEEINTRQIDFGGIKLQNTTTEYILDPSFATHVLEVFTTTLRRE